MSRESLKLAGAAALAIWMFGSALALGLLCLPLLLGPRRYALIPIKLWGRWVLTALRLLVGARVEVRGREHLPPGACLVAAKHQGMLDIVVAVSLLPDPCIVLKKELMLIPIFGWYAWKAGMIPIRRGAGLEAIRIMSEAATIAAAQGRQVLIYPEGTRTEPGAAPAYKHGVAAVYRQLGAPCVPMATNSGTVWPAHGLAKHPGLAVFELLAPIPPGLKRGEFMATLERGIEGASLALLRAARPGNA